ncbi:hypothetical protein BCR44DRAFT_1152829 [Catenaria anguillulae PL171]|uniref:Uncharacterized protein n=1 Tax=Catenaria anguillulae PL171 TaxID=765915 RepID=A0A1Y2HKA7_9FUNG|nr:hypothetical protein BCR44DRAFT_1152829 [Catenaria anguillulae PL171]
MGQGSRHPPPLAKLRLDSHLSRPHPRQPTRHPLALARRRLGSLHLAPTLAARVPSCACTGPGPARVQRHGNQVAHILDLVKLAGSPAMHLRPVSRDTHGVRAVVFVSDVAAQFPTVEVKIESTAAESNSVAESNKTSKVIKVAKVYKDSEDIVVRLCKRATSIVRAGVIMQDLLPLIETGAQHASIHFNAAKDSQFAPVNASDLALGVHVLAHCLATGRTHPAFAPPLLNQQLLHPLAKARARARSPHRTLHPPPCPARATRPHLPLHLTII